MQLSAVHDFNFIVWERLVVFRFVDFDVLHQLDDVQTRDDFAKHHVLSIQIGEVRFRRDEKLNESNQQESC